jgi:hypothetical protein
MIRRQIIRKAIFVFDMKMNRRYPQYPDRPDNLLYIQRFSSILTCLEIGTLSKILRRRICRYLVGCEPGRRRESKTTLQCRAVGHAECHQPCEQVSSSAHSSRSGLDFKIMLEKLNSILNIARLSHRLRKSLLVICSNGSIC